MKPANAQLGPAVRTRQTVDVLTFYHTPDGAEEDSIPFAF